MAITADRNVQLLNAIIFNIFNISLVFSSGETLFSRLRVLLVIVVLLAINMISEVIFSTDLMIYFNYCKADLTI